LQATIVNYLINVNIGAVVIQNVNLKKRHNSRNNLRKLIKKTLEKTNWRLMSEGINYRLGYLNGRLKGYENEEDLMRIVK